MVKFQEKNIIMNYKDYGIEIPAVITNTLETDEIKINIYNKANELKLEKNMIFKDERWSFEFTKEESNSLTIADYWYEIIQYRNGKLQNTINKGSLFRIE